MMNRPFSRILVPMTSNFDYQYIYMYDWNNKSIVNIKADLTNTSVLNFHFAYLNIIFL